MFSQTKIKLLLSIVIGLGGVVTVLSLSAGKVYAASIPPSVVSEAQQDCAGQEALSGQIAYVAQVDWLSAGGNPTQTNSVSGQPGSTVPLQWNQAIYYCQPVGSNGTYPDPHDTISTNFNAASSTLNAGSVGSISSIVGNTALLSYNNTQQWSQSDIPFNYYVPNNLTPGNYTIGITVGAQAINNFGTYTQLEGAYQCVGATVPIPPGEPASWYQDNGFERTGSNDFDSPQYNCITYNSTYNITVTVSNAPNTGSNPCPVPPGIVNSNNEATVYLPNIPTGYSSSAPSPTPYQGGYVQTVPEQMMINSANDQYGQSIPWSPTGWQYNPFSLDYTNYIMDYPYDEHTTYINYSQQYMYTYWYTYSSPSYFTCPSGGYVSSPWVCTVNITYSYPAAIDSYVAYTAIPNGWYCPSGGTLSGSTCYVSYTYTYTAEAWYSYYSYYSYNGTVSTTNSSSAPQLPEICLRNFTVLSPGNTDISGISFSGGTIDQPSTVTISAHIGARFNYIYGGLGVRQPMSVNGLSYTGQYYIEHANGTRQLLGGGVDNESVAVGSTYANGGTATGYVTKNYTVSMPPLEVGDQICAQFTISPEQGQMNEYGTIQNGNGTVNSTSIPNPPTCSSPVSNDPYARFYGNDVVSGSQFYNSNIGCNPSGAGIIGTTSPGGTRAIGSGSQFAAMSLGQISNFATAFLRNTLPTSTNGLTLANTTSPPYGGNYSSGCQEIFNYYGLKPSNVSPTSIGGSQTYDINAHSSPNIQWLTNVGNYVTLVNNNTTLITVQKTITTYQTRSVLVFTGSAIPE